MASRIFVENSSISTLVLTRKWALRPALAVYGLAWTVTTGTYFPRPPRRQTNKYLHQPTEILMNTVAVVNSVNYKVGTSNGALKYQFQTHRNPIRYRSKVTCRLSRNQT